MTFKNSPSVITLTIWLKSTQLQVKFKNMPNSSVWLDLRTTWLQERWFNVTTVWQLDLLRLQTEAITGNRSTRQHANSLNGQLATELSHTCVVRSANNCLRHLSNYVNSTCLTTQRGHHKGLHLSSDYVSCLVAELNFCTGELAYQQVHFESSQPTHLYQCVSVIIT